LHSFCVSLIGFSSSTNTLNITSAKIQKRRGETVKGALVFITVFVVFLIATLGYPDLPPAKAVYGLLGVPETDYPVLGIGATLLTESIINGVIYGVIAWAIFTFGTRAMSGK